MSATLRGVLIGVVAVVLGLCLLVAGVILGRYGWGMMGYGPSNMMAALIPNAYAQTDDGQSPCGYGTAFALPHGAGMGAGMMGNFGTSGLYGEEVKPLSLNEAEAAVDNYLGTRGNEDLVVAEVMIFDNHAYAEVVEQSTGIGAFEVLVDPITLDVVPEPGPNMMWNTKYGHMSGFGMGGNAGWMQRGLMGSGGMMGTGGSAVSQSSAEMPVSPEEAIETAQSYLDRYLPGSQVEDEADPFYGYYTLHITRDGQTIGMLSVNGYTQQVFPHTWHGDFLEMSEEAHSS